MYYEEALGIYIYIHTYICIVELVAKQSCSGKDLIGKAPRLQDFYQWQGVSGFRLVGCSIVNVTLEIQHIPPKNVCKMYLLELWLFWVSRTYPRYSICCSQVPTCGIM